MIELRLTLPSFSNQYVYSTISRRNFKHLMQGLAVLLCENLLSQNFGCCDLKTYAAPETRLFATVKKGGIPLISRGNCTPLSCDEQVCELVTTRIAREISHTVLSL
jgi:hypothetical protein